MLNENLKTLRKAKGISQESLASQLNVVRQTVSKWEKGLSVPDAEMLIRISEVLDTSVSTLLGGIVEVSTDKNAISQQLEQLNLLLAERNRRSRRIWKVVAAILISVLVITIIQIMVGIVSFNAFMFDTDIQTSETSLTHESTHLFG